MKLLLGQCKGILHPHTFSPYNRVTDDRIWVTYPFKKTYVKVLIGCKMIYTQQVLQGPLEMKNTGTRNFWNVP